VWSKSPLYFFFLGETLGLCQSYFNGTTSNACRTEISDLYWALLLSL